MNGWNTNGLEFALAMSKKQLMLKKTNTVRRIENTGAQIINKAAPLPCHSILQFQTERESDKDLNFGRWNVLLRLDKSKRPDVLLLIKIAMVCSFLRTFLHQNGLKLYLYL